MHKKTKRRNVLRYFLMAFISIVLGFGLYSCSATLTGQKLPMPFGYGVGVVMTGSMEPDLSVDDLVVVKKCDNYEVGEWVVFQQRGMIIVHELVCIDGEDYITKGTANNVEDTPIKYDDIKGKVIKKIDDIGVIVKWIKSPFGTIAVLLLAGWLLVRSYIKEDNSDSRVDDEDLQKIQKEIETLKNSLGINPKENEFKD